MSKAAVSSTLAALSACLSACLALDDLSTPPAPDPAPAAGDAPSAPSAAPPTDRVPVVRGTCNVTELIGQQAHSEGPGSGWSSAMNALADDDARAETGLSVDNRDSALLVVDQLKVAAGPAIPNDATIKGVFVDVDRSTGSTCVMGREIGLRVANEALARTKGLSSVWDQPARFGDANDLWGGAPIAAAAFSNGNTAVTVGLHFEGDKLSCGGSMRFGRVDVVHVSVAWCP